MKLQSWNVNGIRAVMKKGFQDYLAAENPDIAAFQEVKAKPEQVDENFPGYHAYWHSAERKGYAGTLTLSKKEPLQVIRGIGNSIFDAEGRVLTLEFENFYHVNIYSPNSKNELARLDERMVFEDLLRAYLHELKAKKGVLVCGDLNVAHREIDLKNPQSNHKNAGFSDEERAKFTELLDSGFIDTFRYFYPEEKDAYTWWSFITRARERNAGWRIDYYLASEDLENRLEGARILSEIMGSDHCPVELTLKD